jgi:chloride channel 3/4/5
MIWFNGFPFLDNKEEHTFGVPISHVMTSELTTIPSQGLAMKEVTKLLSENKYQGFPVVEDQGSHTLLGYIGRTELRYAIDRIKRERSINPNARCFFTPQSSAMATTPLSAAPVPPVTFDAMPSASGQMSVDFSRFIDPTPLSVHPRLPLETVMELFKKMGPRVILIEHRGQLVGLVTVKDCLKYQFKVEASENPRDDSALLEAQDRLWEFLKRSAGWAAEMVATASMGRIKPKWGDLSEQHRRSPAHDTRDLLDGTEDDDLGMELDNRQ